MSGSTMSTQMREQRHSIGSVQEMHALAAELAKRMRPGTMIGLSGPLGAGKTEFVRGFARALGARDEVSSPSFVLETVYDLPDAVLRGVQELRHWDLFRITSGDLECELADHSGDPTKLTLVEWPERIEWVRDLLDLEILISLPDLRGEGESSPQAHVSHSCQREVRILERRAGVLDSEL